MGIMMRRLVLLLVAVVVCTPSPARAETWTTPDDPRDVVGVTEGPEECGSTAEPAAYDGHDDAIGLKADLADRFLRTTLDFRRLRADYRVSLRVTVRTGSAVFHALLSRASGGPERVRLRQLEPTRADRRACAGTSSARVRCDGLRGDVRAGQDRVRVVVPRRCMGDTRWVRVGAVVSRTVDRTTFVDRVALSPRISEGSR